MKSDPENKKSYNLSGEEEFHILEELLPASLEITANISKLSKDAELILSEIMQKGTLSPRGRLQLQTIAKMMKKETERIEALLPPEYSEEGGQP